jgi:hypothetical protein
VLYNQGSVGSDTFFICYNLGYQGFFVAFFAGTTNRIKHRPFFTVLPVRACFLPLFARILKAVQPAQAGTA